MDKESKIKNKLALFAMTFLLHATSSMAMPMLIYQCETCEEIIGITGLNVWGTLYDVGFGDDSPGNAYKDITFDADRELEANAVSSALADAMNTIGGVDASFISGCGHDFGDFCTIFLADSIDQDDDDYLDVMFIDLDDAIWNLADHTLSLWVDADTSSFSNQITVATYINTGVAVPIPTTLGLFCLGLVSLGWSHGRQFKRDIENLGSD